MKPMLAIIAVMLALGACQSRSSEEQAADRLDRWASACGYPTGQGLHVSAKEERMLRACVLAHEQAYRADRAARIERGALMMQYGTRLMDPPRQGFNCIATPQGPHVITRCR